MKLPFAIGRAPDAFTMMVYWDQVMLKWNFGPLIPGRMYERQWRFDITLDLWDWRVGIRQAKSRWPCAGERGEQHRLVQVQVPFLILGLSRIWPMRKRRDSL